MEDLTDAGSLVCFYCNNPGDLRPYGPQGAMICFSCIKENPQREKLASQEFIRQVEACGKVVIIDASNTGPYPYPGTIRES